MKIAINTLSENPLSPSGAFEYYKNIINALAGILQQDDILYIFVSKCSNKFFGPYKNTNIKKIIFKYSNEQKHLRILTEHFIFPLVIIKYKINLLNTGTSIIYCPCKLVATLKTMHVYTNPTSMTLFTRVYRKSVYWLSKFYNTNIISNSNSNTKDIIKYVGIHKSKIHLVYEGVNHKIFKVKHKNVQNSHDLLKKYRIKEGYILFVSSLYSYKNAESLIEAYAKLKNGINTKYQLVIAGYPREIDYYHKILNLVRQYKIQKNIIFTGGLSHHEVARLYQNAYVFVYPSFYETFGLTILEAMACGCPVIASNKGSIPEVGGKAALYIDPNCSEDLKLKIELIYSNVKTRKSLVTAGLKRCNEFTWNKTARQTYQTFKELYYK